MNNLPPKILRVFSILCLLFLYTEISFAQNAEIDPVVVGIDRGPKGLIYKVDSKVSENLLQSLGAAKRERVPLYTNPPPPLIIIFPNTAKFTDIDNVRGIASKAGYSLTEISCFAFDKDKTELVKIDFSKPFPFTTDPKMLNSGATP